MGKSFQTLMLQRVEVATIYPYTIPMDSPVHSTSDYTDFNQESPRTLLPGIWTLLSANGLTMPCKAGIETETFQPAPKIEMIHQPRKRKEFKRTLFTEAQRAILIHWLKEHQSNPYPTPTEKQDLMKQTGLNRDQINVWFTNNRVRHGISCSGHHQRPQTKASTATSSPSATKFT